ncbi:MAG: DUF2339 domain-containing protein [Mesorhizobium sp.]|nr:DUF2339 domain-containing protein [Mesorhizobium sp.]MBN9244467.1 DUF2339 domain-containing protein [Mesorhizobium sp.]MBN9270470.1 DUF2339 domain-containing protein [Mesorhizobium sp.]
MFESLIGLAAIIALFVILSRQQARLALVERELAALRGLVLGNEPAAGAASVKDAAASPPLAVSEGPGSGAPPDIEAAASADSAPASGPWGVEAAAPAMATAAAQGPVALETSPPETKAAEAAVGTSAPKAKTRDIETALGTRWAVWVGGLALALGGLFLVRYTIEAGVFGPEVRIAMAAVLGLVLVGGGEFVRRTGFKMPVEGAAGAYIPAILTAAGAFTLFGTVYAAHAVYGFVGPATAFALLGLIALGTIGLALVHGQALAGIGLLGALATPLLVATQSRDDWALFGYLAIVLAAAGFVARIRSWAFLMTAAFFGIGFWTLLYIGQSPGPDYRIVLFIGLVTLAVLAFAWLGGRREQGAHAGVDLPAAVSGLFVGLSVLALFYAPYLSGTPARIAGALLVAAMLAVALYRRAALALVHAAGATSVLVFLGIVQVIALSPDSVRDFLTPVEAMPPVFGSAAIGGGLMRWLGIALAAAFIAAGFRSGRRLVASAPLQAATWAGWAVAVPLVVMLALWVTYGNIDRDYGYAAFAVLLAAVFVAGSEWIASAEQPPLSGGGAVSFALAGAGIAGLAFLHMAFGSGLTTVLAGAAALVPALATRRRSYPVLGWLSVGAAVAVLARVAFDPTIVGADALSLTPVFNWLLPGYGIPALAFAASAWQLARTTAGRPRLAMEASAALFALLTLAMLVRHAMHGGVIDAGAPTLAEQAIYTLIALGFAAILVSIDQRAPSSVLRYGSLAIGVLSVLSIIGNHFLWLNPLFTDESTGSIPVFNLLFLAYLLPAVAAGLLALYVRGKRPRWYSAMLALTAALLAFAYATLSVRRLFKGQFIGLWSGMEQVETYTYSALWLAIGVVLLVVGVRLRSQVLRIASAALIAVAVLKVFLFDMSELEGVLRALSFIGLGAVLIGIGLFYQRLLTPAKKGAEAAP